MRLTEPIVLEANYSEEDIFDIVKVIESTVSSSEFRQLLYGKIPPDELQQWLVEDVRYNLLQEFTLPSILSEDDLGMNIERREHVIVRDLDLPPSLREPLGGPQEAHPGRIVGHAEFRYLPTNWIKNFDGSGNRKASTPSKPPPIPETANTGLIQHFRSAGLPFVVQLYGGKQRFLLKDVSTLPSHARKGVGGKLVSWIFPESDRKGVPVVLSATTMGLPLYKKLGFQEVPGELGVLRIDRGLWGGEGINEQVFMIRLPNAPEQEMKIEDVGIARVIR